MLPAFCLLIMHLRDDFERMQQTHAVQHVVSRSPSASIPQRSPVGLVASPYRMIHPGMMHSPHGIALVGHPPGAAILHSPGIPRQSGFSPVRFPPGSPYMLLPQVGAPLSSSRKRPRDIDDHSVSPAIRRRRRGESASSSSRSNSSRSSSRSSSSSLGYSSSDQENSVPGKQFGKPPSPPKYFPQGEEFDDIDSSDDSDYEDNQSDASGANDVDDLRHFIDFDPKYNRSQISKKKHKKFSATGDPLRDFLFHDAAKPRKWFSTFAWNAVGAKLARKAKTSPKHN